MKKLSTMTLLTILSFSSVALGDTDFVNAPNPHTREALDFVNNMNTNIKMPTNMNDVPNYDASKYHNKIDHESQDYLDQTKSDGERLRNDPNNMAGQINNINQDALTNKQTINPDEAFLKSSNNVTNDLDHHYPWTEQTVKCTPDKNSPTKDVSSSLNKCYIYNENLKFNDLNGLILTADSNYICNNNVTNYNRIGKQNLKVNKSPLFDRLISTHTNLSHWIFSVKNNILELNNSVLLNGYPIGGTAKSGFKMEKASSSHNHSNKDVGSRHYETEFSFNLVDKTKVETLLLESLTGSNAINLYVNNELVYAYGVKDNGQTSKAIRISEQVVPETQTYSYKTTKEVCSGYDSTCDTVPTTVTGQYTIYHHNINFNDGVIIKHNTGSLKISNIDLLPFLHTGQNTVKLEAYTFGSSPVNAKFTGTKYATYWTPYVYDMNKASSSDICQETSSTCLIQGTPILHGDSSSRTCITRQQTLSCTIGNVQNLGNCRGVKISQSALLRGS